MIPFSSAAILPSDYRARQGGWLFLGMLSIFFITGMIFYGLYAWDRRDDPFSAAPLPLSFVAGTACLVLISVLLHRATKAVRRDRLARTTRLLAISAAAAVIFLAVQLWAMSQMLSETMLQAGNGRGLVGMVVVLAFLHALHVAGGVIALGVVAARSAQGRYDHERHFAVDFTAHYWHFLDVVWLVMLTAFWFTTGGF